MEVPSPELPVEDVLNLRQGWIAQLYVEERKTEGEIVDLLHEHGFTITLVQFQGLIREWGLVQPPSVEITVNPPSPTLSDDCETVGSPPPTDVSTQPSYTPSDPVEVSKYIEKPLPSLPPRKTHRNSSKIQKKRPSSTTDRLGVTCHHGPSASDFHDVEASLEHFPGGHSPIETYLENAQTHELIALGLEPDFRAAYRRAKDTNNSNINAPRAWHRTRRTRRKEDGGKGDERTTTPPSRCDES